MLYPHEKRQLTDLIHRLRQESKRDEQIYLLIEIVTALVQILETKPDTE